MVDLPDNGPLRVGLDFGTSNSGIAWYDGQSVHALPIDRENVAPEVVKTILYISRDYQAYIGQEAISLYYKNNINRQRRFVKKWVGEIDIRGADMHYVDDVYTLVDELTPGRLLQFIKTGLRSDGYHGTRIFERYYDLKAIIRTYLEQIRLRAERLVGRPIFHVTLGRPVQFFEDPVKDHASQETLRQAALEAGFESVEFELEPIAAALFYEASLNHPETALVFDFGGGTLDITIMRLGLPAQARQRRQVLASGGIGIAGSDFDQAIIQERMLEHFGRGATGDHDIDALVDSISDWQVLPQLSTPTMKHRLEQAIHKGLAAVRLQALQALIFNDLSFQFYNRVEAAKIALSDLPAAVLRMEAEDIHIWEMLTRLQFEQDIAGHYQKIERCLLDTLSASGLKPGQIDSVIRTGGSSSVPCFIEMLNRIFSPDKVKTSSLFGSVTGGLAIRAREL